MYNYCAARALVGSVAEWEKAKNPLTGAVPNQAKAFFPRIPLETTTKQHPLKGFFTPIAAVSEYGSDKQPNDISGSATRTRMGGNGGRIPEPMWERVNLLNRVFSAIALRPVQVWNCRNDVLAPKADLYMASEGY